MRHKLINLPCNKTLENFKETKNCPRLNTLFVLTQQWFVRK